MSPITATCKSWERAPRRRACGGPAARTADCRGLALGLVESGLSRCCPHPKLLAVRPQEWGLER